MECHTHNFLPFWVIFLPFYPTIDPWEITIGKINKKTPEDNVHMCTINDDHMMFGSLDLKRDGQCFLSFWTFFCPLTWKTKTNLKNQDFDKMKNKPGDILILQLCNTNDDHIMYGSWDMKHQRQNFLLFWPFMPFYPTNNPKNQNVEKKKKILGDIILHNCTKNHARDGCNLCFFFCLVALSFAYLPPNRLNKKKKRLDILFYTCVSEIMITWWRKDERSEKVTYRGARPT